MKTIAKYLAIIVVTSSTMFTACVSKKKMKASAAHIEQLKKDSIATHRKLDAKMAAVAKKQEVNQAHVANPATEAHVAKHETHVSTVLTKPEHISPLPTSEVESAFKLSYPDAHNIVWTNEVLHSHPDTLAEKAFKASFLTHEKHHTVVYAENGKLVEARSEILPEQLPENVYEAIKKQFPEEQIVSASTFKSSRSDGSYTAVVKSKLHEVEKNLIIAENGTIVKH